MVDKAKTGRLSDGRGIRAVDGEFTQADMFRLGGTLSKTGEHIATLPEADDALTKSMVFKPILGDRWVRTGEYCVSGRKPDAPLGKETLWIENGVRYRMIIPDVQVLFCGNMMSLREVTWGMGVFDSIELLQIAKTGEKEYTVSPADHAALMGKVGAVRFMAKGWVQADGRGLPDADKAASADDPSARHIWMRTNFEAHATGWHGSLARGAGGDGGRSIVADLNWSVACGVAAVGADAPAKKKPRGARP